MRARAIEFATTHRIVQVWPGPTLPSRGHRDLAGRNASGLTDSPSNQRHASRSQSALTAPLKRDPSAANSGHIVAGQKLTSVIGVPTFLPAPRRPP